MSAINPRTVEELLGMPTADINAMTDEELRQWCLPFWPHTRPLAVATTAVKREVAAVSDGLSAGSQERLAKLRADREAAKSGATKMTGTISGLRQLNNNK